MPIFNRYPLEEIIIHPRTGIQMYDGGTDLGTFEQCLEQSVHRVVYNGDITDLKSFRDIFARFEDVTDWMIGRCAVSSLFSAAIINSCQDDLAHQVEEFRQFYEELYEKYRQAFS